MAATVNELIDFVYGKELQTDDVGAVARFVREHVTRRPAAGGEPRWPNIDAMKSHTNFSGPTCTAAQIDAALAAYVAS